MKNLRSKYFAITLISLLTFIGCNTTPQIANPSSDASILSAYIQKNDSSPNASSAVFTINQTDSLIYNVDSLPYGTRVDSLFLTFTFASSSGFVINDTVPESPSYSYYSSSSNSGSTSQKVDLSKQMKIKNLATDGKSIMTYKLEVRVHKVETYLHVWSELNKNVASSPADNQKALLLNKTFYYFHDYTNSNKLYTSSDAINWADQGAVSSLPLNAKLRNMQVYNDSLILLHNGNEIYKSVDGKNWKKQLVNGDANYDYSALLFSFKDRLWAVAQHKTNKTVRIANSFDGVNWTFSEKRIFSNFPIDNFSATRFKPTIGREKVIVTGGISANGEILNTLWSAENRMGVDTLYWVNLQHKTFKFSPIYNTSTTYYGSKMLMLGGAKSHEAVSDTLYQLAQSIDEGLTWTKPDSTINRLPDNFKFRSNVSVIEDEANKTLYVIGGKSATSTLSDVWKVKVNFYGFKDYLENPTKY